MDEDEYVETSDVEELNDVYELSPLVVSVNAGIDSSMNVNMNGAGSKREKEKRSQSNGTDVSLNGNKSGSRSQQRDDFGDWEREGPKKRRKLSHVGNLMCVSGSKEGGSGVQIGIGDGKEAREVGNVELSKAFELRGIYIEDPQMRNSQLPKDTTGNNSQNIIHDSSQRMSVSPNSQLSEVQEDEELSGDELNMFPPESTSPLPTSEVGSRASAEFDGVVEQHDDEREESPLSDLSSSPPSPRSPISRVEEDREADTPTSKERSKSPSRSRFSERTPEQGQDLEQELEHIDQEGRAQVEIEAETQRYPLRQRRPNQLRPYLFDKGRYNILVPPGHAAHIDPLRLDRRRKGQHLDDQYEEDFVPDETQTQEETQESDDRRERTKARSPERELPLPAFLEPLSESDNEGIDDIAKEARRIEGERRRREKEERQKERLRKREKENEARKKTKRFPRLPASGSDTSAHDGNDRVRAKSTEPVRIRVPSATPEAPPPRKEGNELDALREYFMDDPEPPELGSPPSSPIPSNQLRTAIPTPPREDQDQSWRSSPIPWSRRATTPLRENQTRSSPMPWDQAAIVVHTPPTNEDGGCPTGSLPRRNGSIVESSPTESEEESDQELQKYMSKQYRILYRMYPPKVAEEMLKKDKAQFMKRRRDRSHSVDSATDVSGPLLPGQTRVRRATNVKDAKEIKGDSESSEDERQSPYPESLYGDIRDYVAYAPPSPPRTSLERGDESRGLALPRRRNDQHFLTPLPEVIELSEDEDSCSSSEDDELDDEEINEFLIDDAPEMTLQVEEQYGHRKVKEESMIDWMLSRTRIVGSSISKPKGTRSKKRSSYNIARSRKEGSGPSRPRQKIDVVTGGARRMGSEHQTRLDFSRHTSSKKGYGNVNNPKAGMATDPDASDVELQPPEPAKRKTWKERRKEKQDRAKRQGVYLMGNPQQAVITTGRLRKPVKFTIDLDDENFYQFFDPARLPNKPAAPTRVDKGKHRATETVDLTTDDHFSDNSKGTAPGLPPRPRIHHRKKQCTVDMGIENLQSGIRFDLSSFIGRGWLHELLLVLDTKGPPVLPETIYLCGLSIGPSINLDDFIRNVNGIYDGLMALATDLPSVDQEDSAKTWNTLARSSCRSITWFYSREASSKRIAEWVKTKVLAIVSQLESLKLETSALNNVFLSLVWFCIETSVRTGHRSLGTATTTPESNPLQASLRLMVRYLIAYGFRKSYKSLHKSQTLGDTKMPCYVAEIWICLIHLLPTCAASQPSETHPLWSEILLVYQSKTTSNSFATSELLWKAVFALMALSQFSSHGMTTGNTRLPACWNLVAYTIKQVHLSQNSAELQHLGPGALRKRDEYISIIISRCYHLLDYWKWRMDHAFSTLNQLVDIFRARNFVNLVHEEADYPDFMLNQDWDSLIQLRSTSDTAFTSILKLLKQAIDSGSLSQSDVRKMLALIIPISRFKTAKEGVPDANDLSPICNRLAAIALAIAIEPASATRRVAQVHKSIDFKESDLTTRTLVIRGIRLLASLMVQKDISIQGAADWLKSMVEDIVAEFKALRAVRYYSADKQKIHATDIRNCMLLVLALYAAGRLVLETYANKSHYPDVAFLLAFKPFLDSSKVIEEANCNMFEMRRFCESFLDARTSFLPLPEPPTPAAPVEESESQDYGNFDFGIDLNDPTTLAQLGDNTPTFETIRSEEQKLLQGIIFPSFWVAHRKLKRFCESVTNLTDGWDIAHLKALDSWTYCLVGCMHILIQHQHGGALKDWSFCLEQITTLWKGVRVDWLKMRLQLTVYFQILRHDPTFYPSHRLKFLELVFESLAAFNTTIEPFFWRLVTLYEKDSNFLLKDTIGFLPATNSTEFEFGKDLRLFLLQVILKNIETAILESEVDSQKSLAIELCFKMLSIMRSNSQDLLSNSDARLEYHTWCKEVFTLFQDLPRLKSQPRLSFLLDWSSTLSNSSSQ